MIIPKILLKDGVHATKAAKEAITKLENSVKKEVITPEKLVRTPSSDVFEKKAYMETEAFWNKPQNFAMNARNSYLTEGGEAFEKSQQQLLGKKVISTDGNLERGFEIFPGQAQDTITYYERNLQNGQTRTINLFKGRPYSSYDASKRIETRYDPLTGAPSSSYSYRRNMQTIYAKDGSIKTQISRTPEGMLLVKEAKPDGSFLCKTYKNGRMGRSGFEVGDLIKIEKYDSNDKLEKRIMLHKGTKNPSEIYSKKDGFITRQYFDKDGTLMKTFTD